jgi:uncharacterized protein YjbJ (UPF0337 family)
MQADLLSSYSDLHPARQTRFAEAATLKSRLASSRPVTHPGKRSFAMNKDQVKGRVTEAKGHAKEVAGKAVGSEKLKAEGRLDQATGKVQKNWGDAKEDLKDDLDDAASRRG